MSVEIDELHALIAELQDQVATTGKPPADGLERLFVSIESSLSAIAAKTDTSTTATALGELGRAIKAIKFTAPAVSVNVSPTPITVQVPTQSAPVVNVTPSNWKTCDIEVTEHRGGRISKLKITRLL